MHRLKKYGTLLQAIIGADPKTRVAIIRSAPHEFILTLIEIAFNFLQGNLKVSPTTFKQLKHRKQFIRKVSGLRGKEGVKEARQKLCQRGGFLALLPLIAGVTALAPIIARKVAAGAANSALDVVETRVKKAIEKL